MSKIAHFFVNRRQYTNCAEYKRIKLEKWNFDWSFALQKKGIFRILISSENLIQVRSKVQKGILIRYNCWKFSYFLTRQFNCGFFYPLSLSFLSRKYFLVGPNIYRAIFQDEFNELGFEAIRQLVIVLKSQLRLSGARLT